MGIISVKMVVVKGVDIPVLAKYVYRFTIALEYTYLGGIEYNIPHNQYS